MRAARLRADRAGVLHHADARHGPDGVTAHRTTLLALAAAVAAAPLPAWAMCDMRVIENRSIEDSAAYKIGRAHVCTPVTNAHLVCRLLLDNNNDQHKKSQYSH